MVSLMGVRGAMAQMVKKQYDWMTGQKIFSRYISSNNGPGKGSLLSEIIGQETKDSSRENSGRRFMREQLERAEKARVGLMRSSEYDRVIRSMDQPTRSALSNDNNPHRVSVNKNEVHANVSLKKLPDLSPYSGRSWDVPTPTALPHALSNLARIVSTSGTAKDFHSYRSYEKPTWKRKRLAAESKHRRFKKSYGYLVNLYKHARYLGY
ncbi:hypothetical protein V1511DRAFT_503250 [Dipodascopsis uninucleata]